MPTTVTYAVRAAPGGGEYASVQAAINAAVAANADLVTADVQPIIEVYNDWTGDGLNGKFNLDGFTTDATRYPIIRGVTGTQGSGLARVTSNEGVTHNTAEIRDNYARVERLIVTNRGAASSSRAMYNSASFTKFISCIFSSDLFDAFENISDSGCTLAFCIFRDSAGYGFKAGNFDACTLYNCGAYGNVVGFYREGTGGTSCTAINCWSYGNSTSDWSGSKWTGNNNASEDGTTIGTTIVDNALVAGDFTDIANDDFSPAVGSSLLDSGADLSSQLGTLGITSDINGDPVSTPFNVGPDAFDEASGSTANIAITEPMPVFSVSAEATTPAGTVTADIAITDPLPVFSVAAEATLPQPVADIAITEPMPIFAISATAASSDPIIQFSSDKAMAFNSGSVRTNLTGLVADVYNPATGALVLRVTGHTTGATGIPANIQSASLSSATEYRIVIQASDGAEAVFRETSQ